MGNILGVVSDDEIIRFCIKFPIECKNEVLQIFESNPIYRGVYINGHIFIFLCDSIDEFIQRDIRQFQMIKEYVLSQYKEINWKIHISGQEVEQNQSVLQKLQEICGNQKDQFNHTKVIDSISQALHYYMRENHVLYNFNDTISIIDLIKKKVSSEEELYPTKIFAEKNSLKYPYVLVNLRGGVSFYKVKSEGNQERLFGSIIGENTIEGIVDILKVQGKMNKQQDSQPDEESKVPEEPQQQNQNQQKSDNVNNLDQLIKDAFLKGDNRKVDMTVEDIYGSNTEQLGLDKDLLASSLGKLAKFGEKLQYDSNDLARSFLSSFAANLSLITSLTMQLEPEIQQAAMVSWKIDNPIINYIVQCFIEYYSKGKITVYFVENSKYAASIGVTVQN